jgi:2-polyprenyl-3-methyl-5-hydroxy-6-metoxy-1,4-benzoquinol methylase
MMCVACGTLVSQASLGPEQVGVGGDDDGRGDFYGREYWFSHQREDLGLPDIEDRARLDLPERCLYWLRTLLAYKLPPSRTLELGSSHGAFVSLLRYAGFDAMGLEVSRWVVDYAQRTFRIPVLPGPIEQQQLPEQSFDAIILNDVLEHLPDPRRTVRESVSLLKPDGVLLVQTPCYPDRRTYEDLLREEHVFLKMLLENEHIYLFSERSLRHLFASLGCHTLTFKPALFPYDMYVIAGRRALVASSQDEIAAALSTTPNARMVLALLDLDDQYRDLKERSAGLAADRESRIQALLDHQVQLADQQKTVASMTCKLEEVSADSEARLQVILKQQGTIAEQQGVVGDVTRKLEGVSADSEARLQVILKQQRTIAEQQRTIAEQQRTIAEQQRTIAEQQATLAEQQTKLNALEHNAFVRLLRYSKLLRNRR